VTIAGVLGAGVVVAVVLGFVGLVGLLVVQAIANWRDLLSLDRWREVLDTIRRNKLRTSLTMISVAWGIFVLVFLLGLGKGLDNGLHHTFARDAANSISLIAAKTSVAHDGYDVGRKLTFDNRDYDRARATKLPRGPAVEHISGQYFIQGGDGMRTKRNGKASAFSLNAVHPDAIYMRGQRIESGRFLNELDIVQRRKSAVIGRAVREFLFGAENPIGQWIDVAGVPFQVVGVFTGEGDVEQERQLYIPVTTAQLAYNGLDHLGRIEFTLDNATPAQAKQMSDLVVEQIAERHHFDPKDPQAVRIHNNVEAAERFGKIFWMISGFVLVIGVCTLLAGVVGVSNIMMIAVKERTKEIGVRKALGATAGSIVFMVVQEAIFLTGIAGLFGLAGGVALLDLTGRVVKNDFVLNPGIDLGIGIAATAGLIFAGALAGYFPARAAARVNPIHALRDQ